MHSIWKGKAFIRWIYTQCKRIGAVFLKGFHKTSFRIYSYLWSVLEELFLNKPAVFKANSRYKLYNHLDIASAQ